MPTRAEIVDTLAASQTQVLAFFQDLSLEDLERPATANGVPGAAPWRAKDHFGAPQQTSATSSTYCAVSSPASLQTLFYAGNIRRACRCRAFWAIWTR